MSVESITRFRNRLQAGELLASHLSKYAQRKDAIVLALPRGGVPVGYAIAEALQIPLDVLIVRKLGMPGHEEFAVGAIAAGGKCFLQTDTISAFGIPSALIEQLKERELREIERREQLYRSGRPALQLRDHVVILVDDGLATGSTMQIAIQAARQEAPTQLIVAIPVSSQEGIAGLQNLVEKIVCISAPDSFQAVGQWYEDFRQTIDEEVIELLERARKHHHAHANSKMT